MGELIVDEAIEFFLELQGNLLVVRSNIFLDGLQYNGKGVFFGLANEVLPKVECEIFLLVLDGEDPLGLVQFEFGGGPVRESETERLHAAGGLDIVDGGGAFFLGWPGVVLLVGLVVEVEHLHECKQGGNLLVLVLPLEGANEPAIHHLLLADL